MRQSVRNPILIVVAAFAATRPAGVSPAGQDAPLSPEETVRRMQLPAGFRATVFAAEPDVVQPIAFTFDDRGRLWVVECLSYPDWITPGGKIVHNGEEVEPADQRRTVGRDRITIFEDTDGDGRHDKRSVFYDKGKNFTGIEYGFGGVWVTAVPYLLFIPDEDHDDRPDGPPQVLLDGWDLGAKHNVVNGLTWGPDGWLYGCNGILSNSLVGRPGTPPAKRAKMNCGVWRYHPTRHEFEVVAHGTTNPWGLDFDEYGRMFITNCVIEHVFHVVPGGRYKRMHGQHFNPYTYEVMQSCADHIHWGGGPWQGSREGKGIHDAPGGGHAHAGCMIYLGDNWPAEYRGNLFTCNIHGNRVNRDVLKRHRSGYLATHAEDFLKVPDPWFRGLELKYGPDGGVYLTDWCDTGECHDYDDIHRENGRIYKITYGEVQPWKGDLAKQDDKQLLQVLKHRNEWFIRHALRNFQERARKRKIEITDLGILFDEKVQPDSEVKVLRALWLQHVQDSKYIGLVIPREWQSVASWIERMSIERPSRFGVDHGNTGESIGELVRRIDSPVLRLTKASVLQRHPERRRWVDSRRLVGFAEDADDPNIPLMLWYGIEPLVAAEPRRAVDELLDSAKIPLIRRFIARRIAEEVGAAGSKRSALDPLVQLLARTDEAAVQRDVLTGVRQAVRGRRKLAVPDGWADVAARIENSGDNELRRLARELSVLFGEPRAIAATRRRLRDAQAGVAERLEALEILLQVRDEKLLPTLKALISVPDAASNRDASQQDTSLQGAAIRALAAFDDPQIPRLILNQYNKLTPDERDDAVATLTARPAFAIELLKAIERKRVPRSVLSAYTVRQLAAIEHAELHKTLARVWGRVSRPSDDKQALIRRYKELADDPTLPEPDASRGRLVFEQTCAKCHKLFGDGRDVGPELTGSQRTNLDYVLENLVDPSALVGRDYQLTTIVTDGGRIVTGIVAEETRSAVTVKTENEVVIVPASEIEHRRESNVSMMPEGMLEKLSREELRDLLAYLASPRQVPRPDSGTVR